ncbi:kelch domain-containing protein [Colletotrichum graminicola]|uniref:Kelch domain-containing protein n=1 Tax=Colletotrichum graminicola (strain M1.001 / M2 / FGSC 10212) TaxID=645133 RepID=E3R0R1_COLGM|nr:kelch domain-containing protein [Colletotrichum graminicola M1.001]EFQ36699.1 kelch domain-containing protein [Colletotrichum graminicola M1.001]WDK21917.1 kelch domain-containing protein [Colletotrichum graminicola]
MKSLAVASLALLLVDLRGSGAAAQSITGGCPAGGWTYTSVNNIVYLICPNSDYNVDNLASTAVPDQPTCAELCSHTTNCVNVVYEPGLCHLKGAPANPKWIKSNYYTTITAVYPMAPGSIIEKACPFNQSTFLSNNQVFSYCPNSNYPYDNSKTIAVRSLQQCADTCAQTSGCQSVVYEPGLCHPKVPTQNPRMFVDRYYSTFTQLYTLQPGRSTNGKCLGGQTYYVSKKGTYYEICPFSDFNIDNLQSLQAYDIKSCAEICDKTQGCTKVVYEPPRAMCHLKGSPSNANMKQSNYYWTLAAVPFRVKNGVSIVERCPSGATLYTSENGVQYEICPYSNYGVDNIDSSWQPSQNACIEWCSKTPGCYLGQYQPNNGMCWSKGYPFQSDWTQYDAYTTFKIVPTSYAAPAVLSQNGQWSPIQTLPLNPVAAYLVPAYPVVQDFLSFSSFSPFTFGGGPAYFNTAFMRYNIKSSAASQFNVAETKHDMFCPGMNHLADGRLVINGGNTDAAVTIYDPFANTWTRAANMNMGRGYQSSVTLSDGRGFTIGGSYTGGIGGQNGTPMKNGEVYDPKLNKWTALPGALVAPMLTTYDNAGAWRTDNHAWLYAWSNGSVFQAGPSKNMNWYSTSGQGSVKGAGQRNTQNDQMCGVTVMYDSGKIFAAGGAQSYSDDKALYAAHRITLNGVNQSPTVQQLPNAKYARIFAQAIVLPNGQVFVTGGQAYAAGFTDTLSVLQAEVYDPVANTFTPVAALAVPRNYHSTGLLLPDGRVMNGGGGLCYVGGGCNSGNHPDLQFWTPPYMFDARGNPATRPQISSISASQQSGNQVRVSPGGKLTVVLGSSGANLGHVLVRMGSGTHSIDTDQRRIPLTVYSTNGNTVALSIPNDNGVVPPGFWYYFAVAPSGVHSIGLTVNVLAA